MSDFKYNYRNLARNNPKYTGSYQKVNTILNSINKLRIVAGDTISTFNDEFSKLLAYYIGYNSTDVSMSNSLNNNVTKDAATNLTNNSSNNELRTASSVKAYWTLAKCLEGLDNSKTNGRRYVKTNEDANSEMWDYEKTDDDMEYEENIATLLECIKEVGKEYIENVYTYHGANRFAYIDQGTKDSEKSIENQLTKTLKNQNSEDYDVKDSIFDNKKNLLRSTTNAYAKWNERKEEVYDKIYEQVKKNFVTSDEDLTDAIEKQIDDLSKETLKSVFTQMKTIKGKNTTTNPTAIHYIDLFDEYENKGEKPTIYNYDNTIELEKANTKTFVGDDCSCFAAAVYLHYLNKVDGKKKDKVDLWTTGSGDFISKTNRDADKILNILKDNGFKIYKWKKESNDGFADNQIIETHSSFKLKPGDLLYRAKNGNISAHVEFYLGKGKSFGWGEIQTTYEDNRNSKHFEIIRDKIEDYNLEKGLKKTADKLSAGEKYKIDEKCEPGIYNTVKAYDANCRYDYVIRLENKSLSNMEVGDE